MENKKEGIFNNWNDYSAGEVTFVRKLYNEAIKEILDSLGGFPEVNLK